MTLVTTLVFGLSVGAVYALLAAGVTVVYQAARVPNVAIVAIGTVAAVLHGDLMTPGGRVGFLPSGLNGLRARNTKTHSDRRCRLRA